MKIIQQLTDTGFMATIALKSVVNSPIYVFFHSYLKSDLKTRRYRGEGRGYYQNSEEFTLHLLLSIKRPGAQLLAQKDLQGKH